MSTLQDLIGSEGKASVFYVKLDDPANRCGRARGKSVQGLENYSVRSMREYLSMMTVNSYPGLSTFINVVIGISVVIGFIVIFQAMYTAVMERTREIGIVKSIGASKLYIVNVICGKRCCWPLAASSLEFWSAWPRAPRSITVCPRCRSSSLADGSCAPPASPLSAPSWAHCTPLSKPRRKHRLTRWLTSNEDLGRRTSDVSPVILSGVKNSLLFARSKTPMSFCEVCDEECKTVRSAEVIRACRDSHASTADEGRKRPLVLRSA